MKNFRMLIMELIQMLLLATGILAGMTAEAQVPMRSFSVSVSATVVSDAPVELTTLHNMTVSGEQNENMVIYISPVNSASAGLMRAKGRPGSQARLTYIPTEKLSREDGSGTIQLKFEMSGSSELVQRASKLMDTGEASLRFGPDGCYYLWVGGKVDVANALPGQYSGQFTLEIEYL